MKLGSNGIFRGVTEMGWGFYTNFGRGILPTKSGYYGIESWLPYIWVSLRKQQQQQRPNKDKQRQTTERKKAKPQQQMSLASALPTPREYNPPFSL